MRRGRGWRCKKGNWRRDAPDSLKAKGGWWGRKKGVIAIPIQALAVRSRKDLEAAKNGKKDSNVTLAAPAPVTTGDPKKDEVQGIFVVNGKKATFRPVETGISGVTDIEITKGLQAGDEIVVGSYKGLRTLKPEASGKVDKTAPKKIEGKE